MNRIFYYIFSLINWGLIGFLHLTKYFYKKNNSKNNSILALPFYPKNWPGGEDRIAAWKPFFEQDNIKFNVHWAWESKQLIKTINNTKNNKLYLNYSIYLKILFKRISLIKELKNYRTIWIQRGFIPYFPYKRAYYEKIIAYIHPNIIYDYYDADYESNYNLVFETVKLASSVTVASKFLQNKFLSTNKNVKFLRYAIKTDNIFAKTKQVNNNKIKIGWMGSPANTKQLTLIKEQLLKIEREFPSVLFTFVCRDLPDLGLRNIEILKWGDNNFDYYQWLANVDIGIVPFIEQTDRIKAKISMKTLEFIAAKVPLITSPYVHSDKFIDNSNGIICNNKEWYSTIRRLIEDETLRSEFALNGYNTFLKYHTYKANYPILKSYLLP